MTHAADERFAMIIKGDPPWIAGTLAKDLELFCAGMNAEHGTGEVPGLLAFPVVRIGRPVGHV
jgi:hypothetical protein